jgi:hypothetical protein
MEKWLEFLLTLNRNDFGGPIAPANCSQRACNFDSRDDYFFHHKRPVSPITDLQQSVGEDRY